MARTLTNRASSRRALIDAAVEEFAEKGYEATKVSDIAERAGVTTGALYAHFDGKLDLLMATLGMSSVADFWQQVGDAARRPWHEARVELSRSLAEKPDKRALLLLDTIVLARRDEEVASRIRDGIDTYVRLLQRATNAGTDAGVIDPSLSAEDISALFTAITFGVLVLECVGTPRPSLDAFAHLTDALLQGAHDTEPADEEPSSLARIRARADMTDRSRARLHAAIGEAAEEGYSLRRIGAAAGMSHERVRQILSGSTK